MNFLQSLAEKPWIAQSPGEEEVNTEPRVIRQGKIALRFMLAVVTIFFFLFIITFLARSQFPDFHALAGEPWQPLTDATQLWINTGALLFGGIALQWSKLSNQNHRINGAIIGIIIGIFFTLLFLRA